MSEDSPAQRAVKWPGRARRALTREQQARRPSEVYRPAAARPQARTSRQSVALIGVFLVATALPLVGMIFRLDSAFVLVENRTLASRPDLKLDRAGLADFPARFEAYFNDQFGFRKPLIRWLNGIKVAGLDVSPSPRVILGRNGWLFHGELYLDYYRRVTPFSPKQLIIWQRLLESRRDWLAARGIPYLLVFVPIKSTVYPEYMPSVFNRLSATSRLDQLEAHLKSHSTLAILDLREPLLAAKSTGQIYYKTDTHWNNRGAYAGYSRIMEALSRWFPQLEAIPRAELREETHSEPGKNLALMLAMSDYYRENDSDLQWIGPRFAHEVRETAPPAAPTRTARTSGPDIVYERPDRTLPRAVMFRDSFATWLIPLLSDHFQRIVFSWQYTMERALVEREHPDIVIQEIVERALMSDQMPAE
jgi:alginate O-acetyltransferase complex protein AlgJ